MMHGYNVLLAILLCVTFLDVHIVYGEDWTGSKLGTNDYNMEEEVVLAGKIDYIKAKKNRLKFANRKELLCATFIKAAIKPSVTLYANIATTAKRCDWAIIIYAGDPDIEKEICTGISNHGNIIHCQRAMDAIPFVPSVVAQPTTVVPVVSPVRTIAKPTQSKQETTTTTKPLRQTSTKRKLLSWSTPARLHSLSTVFHHHHHTLQNHTETSSIFRHSIMKRSNAATDAVAKTVLYGELLPYLSNYKRVFLMDEDISLSGFDVDSVLSSWDCSFSPAPLIAQALVSEDTQYMKYLSYNTWRNLNVSAAATGIIEQQVPMFDAIFFEWFIRRVIFRIRSFVLQLGVDWGHDRSWCNAARMYSKEVLGWSDADVPCALLVTATPVHHLNTHSMANKKSNVTSFRERGTRAVQKYIDNYPTWVLMDVLHDPNPLEHPEKFPTVRYINESCLLKRRPAKQF